MDQVIFDYLKDNIEIQLDINRHVEYNYEVQRDSIEVQVKVLAKNPKTKEYEVIATSYSYS